MSLNFTLDSQAFAKLEGEVFDPEAALFKKAPLLGFKHNPW